MTQKKVFRRVTATAEVITFSLSPSRREQLARMYRERCSREPISFSGFLRERIFGTEADETNTVTPSVSSK